MPSRPIDYNQAVADPTASFDSPADVLTAVSLTHEQKVEILRRWEADARELMVASDENMGGGEPPRLDEVHSALRELGIDPEGGSATTTMHGQHSDT